MRFHIIELIRICQHSEKRTKNDEFGGTFKMEMSLASIYYLNDSNNLTATNFITFYNIFYNYSHVIKKIHVIHVMFPINQNANQQTFLGGSII